MNDILLEFLKRRKRDTGRMPIPRPVSELTIDHIDRPKPPGPEINRREIIDQIKELYDRTRYRDS